jgi:hypothetical protein
MLVIKPHNNGFPDKTAPGIEVLFGSHINFLQ